MKSIAHSNQLTRLKRKLEQVQEDLSFLDHALELYFKSLNIHENILIDCIVDGGGDCGIDAFCIFSEGVLITEDEDEADDNDKINSLELYLIQVKDKETFELNALKSIHNFLSKFLDLENSVSEANDPLQKQIKLYRSLYSRLSHSPERLSVKIVYITRGLTLEAHSNIKNEMDFIAKEIRNSGLYDPKYHDSINVDLFGVTELLEAYDKQDDYNGELRFQNSMPLDDGAVFIVSLKDYLDLLSDKDNKIKEHYFAMNIRDYMGNTSETNKEITQRLQTTEKQLDFWCYNNGITIVSEETTNKSKLASIKNLQIVNGLQTSYTLFDFFKIKGNSIPPDKNILVKVVNSSNSNIISDVIRSTNKQTTIPSEIFKMHDEIHISIDEELQRHGFYYEKKPNFYRNKGIRKKDIILPKELAQYYNALILKNPSLSRRSPASLFKGKYKEIFASNVDSYVQCVLFFKKSEELIINSQLYKDSKTKSDVKNLIFHIVALLYNTNKDISSLDNQSIETAIKCTLDKAHEFVIEKGGTSTVLECAKNSSFSDRLIPENRKHFVTK
jgi:hypothetical protein